MPFSFLKFVLICTSWFALTLSISAAVSYWSAYPGFVGTVIVGFIWGSSFWFPEPISKYINFWVILLSGIATFGTQYHFRDWYTLSTGEIIRDISAAETANFSNAAAFEFKDAVVRKDYVGKASSWSKSNISGFNYEYFYAAPLTPASWKPGDAVPAWIVENTGYSKISYGTNQNIRFAILARSWPRADFLSVERAAAKEFNLGDAVNPILLEEVTSIEATIQRKELLLFGLVLWPYCVLLIGSALGLLFGVFHKTSAS